ncbi:hypothetical protein [Streptomyces sp. NBC_00582]|nr:hypothetical protein [Streptomyces sp. NBC_00582]WUB67116.1 hypothetical protein OG852_45300 [Streptomyces sp. NBC_00582]
MSGDEPEVLPLLARIRAQVLRWCGLAGGWPANRGMGVPLPRCG